VIGNEGGSNKVFVRADLNAGGSKK